MKSFKKEYLDRVEYYNYKGELHREDDLPAIESSTGYKSWYINGQLHRTGGPAIEDSDGYKAWYINGLRHREDGPAVYFQTGEQWWFLNDQRYFNQEKYKEEVIRIKLKRLTEL